MIGKIILLCVLIVSTVFMIISVKYSINNKVPLLQALIPVAFTGFFALGVLLVFLSI